jgi:hypothetical protein
VGRRNKGRKGNVCMEEGTKGNFCIQEGRKEGFHGITQYFDLLA